MTEAEEEALVLREREEAFGALYDRVAGRYLHCTSWRHLLAIQSSGLILPSDGARGFSFPGSERSYAVRNRLVALFDFVTPSRRDAVWHAVKWARFLSEWQPVTCAIEINVAWLRGRLVANFAAWGRSEDERWSDLWIPHVEVWVSEPVPWSAVAAVHFNLDSGGALTRKAPISLDDLRSAHVGCSRQMAVE